ncbi:MAG TPA: DUF1638 domain-containing protein [Candidatus Acidoferrales bacterium]|nr:DUF1638 domain-containing protein [Candidatus Acidoferrales bacterium]
MRVSVIACQVMVDQLRSFLPEDVRVDVFSMSQHIRPERLKRRLQQAIDRVDGHCEAILLGFALCSNAVIGLSARKSLLVLPKMHDCVGVFLGSHETYLQEMAREPAFFLSRGYIRGFKIDQNGPFELSKIAERLGEERVEKIIGQSLKPYKRLVYLETGNGHELESDRQYAQELARRFGMKYEEKRGTSELLQRMIRGDWGEDFVIVYPGQEVRLEQFMYDS